MTYVFGQFELDEEAFELRRAGVLVEVQPKVFDLLRFLVENSGRIVRKDELLNAVWPNENVSESALAFSLSHVRKALGQERGASEPLETVHRRGYRFTATVVQQGVPTPPVQRALTLVPPVLDAAAPEPLVGRGPVLDALRAGLAAALTGRGEVVVISAEAGAGKTRVARELAEHARGQGVAVWVGRALDDDAAPVLWPWISVLRQAAEDAVLPAPTRERIAVLVDEVVALQQEGAPEPGRFSLQIKVTDLLRELSRRTPVLVVLEDLQWADELTCRLCRTLVRDLGDANVFVLVTVRPSAAAARSMAKLLAETRVHVLERLSVDEVATYLESYTSQAPSQALAEALWAATGGLPLLLQETLRLLASRHRGARLTSLSVEEIKLLETAGPVLRTRLNALSAPTRFLLGLASVLGTRFEQVALEKMSGGTAAHTLALLDDAMAQRIVVPTSAPGVYAFVHALLRDALYEEIAHADRVTWHAQAALALEPRALDGPRIQELVGHLRRAAAGGDEHRVRLCDYAERAARAARQVGAFADAARYYEWAYEAASALEQPDSHKRAELLVAVGRAQQVAGQVGTARRTFAQAVELAERYGFAELLVNIGQHLRPTFMWASLPDVLAQRALEAALRLAPSNDTRLRALILARLSCTPPHSLGPDHGRVLSRQAVELARSSGNHDAIVDALRSCLASCTGPDDTSSLLAATDELLGLEGQGQRSWAVAEAQLARNLAFFHRGDVERADAALDEYGRMTERLGIAESMFHYERMRLQRRMQQGHYAEARRGSEALWVSAERMELRYAVFFRAMGELELIYELEGAATVLENPALWGALTQWSTLNEYHRAIMIQIACDGGRPEFGRPALEELAAAGFSTITRDLQYLSTLAHLAGAVVRIGDRDKAQALFDLLAPYAHMNTTNFYCSTLGSVAHFVGELAVLLGRAAEATGFLQQAGTRNTEMRLCLCTLRSKLALARHLGDARSPRDRAQVARLLEEVRTEATRLGATSLLKQLS